VADRIKVRRVVLDVNIFLRALIRQGNVSYKIVELWKADQILLIASKEILQEIDEVLKRPWLIEKYGYSEEDVNNLVSLVSRKAILVEPTFSLKLCRDRKDEKYVDCAVLGRVQFLVSEDTDLLQDEKLKKQLFEYGIEVVNALDFYQSITIPVE
jgi:putative PIN family toxin of toxin-antitoxin system